MAALLCTNYAFASPQKDEGVVPASLILDQRWNYDNYTHLVVPTVDWLQSTPLDSNTKLRTRHDNFLMYWLQKNEDVTVHMPDYLINFQNADREFYFIYSGGWIKHALLNKGASRKDCSIAAVEAVLDYYNKDNGVARNDYLDHLVQIQKDGKLNNLFDSSDNANNTYIFLNKPADKHDFKPDENYFTFKYTGINFTRSLNLKYRYKLEGYYDKWIETDEETVTFPNLPSGDFTFTVEASVYPNFEHAVSDSYSFCIATPFYKRPWFIMLMILLCVAIVTLYMRWRERQLKKIAELEHERVLFEYEYLKSQVNPHFLFNSLNTLTSLIDSNPKGAIKYTDHLSDLYRNMLAHPDDNLVTLADELDILQNYLHIQKTRFGDALQLDMDISDELRKGKRIVYLALQLVVENAIKHNIVSQTQPLEINITANEHELVISNPINTKVSKEKSNGMGLANISKRYALATNRNVWYGEENGLFVVKLPLL
ncbi:MAG: histidine kinase [Chitinophagales bacterium]|nr:histidine kinase [Chitinophagales bacterium]